MANAYKRAGSVFEGQLQQNSVVLTKKGGKEAEQTAKLKLRVGT
jgi:hypothetical protein